jgi:hypothetical protein
MHGALQRDCAHEFPIAENDRTVMIGALFKTQFINGDIMKALLVAMFVVGTLAMPAIADDTTATTTTTTDTTTTKTTKVASAKQAKKHAKKKAAKKGAKKTTKSATTTTETAPEMETAPAEGATEDAGM